MSEFDEWEEKFAKSLVQVVRQKVNLLVHDMMVHGAVDDNTVKNLVTEAANEVSESLPPKPIEEDNALVKYLEE